MKKTGWKRNIIVMLLFLLVVLLPQTVCSARKKQSGLKGNISCSVNNGTLTLSGKGAVSPSEIKCKNTDSIKKIVVKRGITSLPMSAFHDFERVKEVVIAGSVKKIGQEALPNSRRLKKVTMPGTFRLVTEWGDDRSYTLEGWESPLIDTICFNTPLSLKTLSYVRSRNLIVSKNDKKYKSIDGVIYSKDGKSVVRVPAYRESLTVEDGCEEFCIQSVIYARADIVSGPLIMCERLKKITLPASVKIVNASKYFSVCNSKSNVKELTIKTDQLDSKNILLLLKHFQISDKESFLKQFEYVSIQDGMCVNRRDAWFLLYTGTADQVTIPDGVKIIGSHAFHGTEIKRAVIPDTVTKIESAAFMYCTDLTDVRLPVSMNAMGTDVFRGCEKLDHVTFPNGMTKVPNRVFQYCYALKEITLPDTVTTIGEEAFQSTSVPASILLQGNIKEIQCFAFSVTGWSEVVLPATVEIVELHAFSMSSLKRVRVCGSTAGIDSKAFCGYELDVSKDTTLTFEKGVEEWQTGLTLSEGRSSHMEFEWQKITGVDGWQIQVSPYKSFQKKKKTYYAKKEKTSMKLTDKKMAMNYVRIRPYKIVDGKRSYGRWAMDTFKRN